MALHEPPYGPGGDRGGHEFAEQRKQLGALIGRGRRGDAVAFFIAGAGAPPEAIEEMRGSPDRRVVEEMEGTLAYDCAVRGDGSVPLDVAGTPTIPTLAPDDSESIEFSTVWPTLQPEVFRAPFGRHIEHQTHDVSPDAPAPVVKEYFGSAVQGEADYGLLHHFFTSGQPGFVARSSSGFGGMKRVEAEDAGDSLLRVFPSPRMDVRATAGAGILEARRRLTEE